MIPAAPLALQPSPPPTLQPHRWQQQWRDAVRDPRELLALLGLDAAAAGISAEAAAQFPLRVPRAFVARMGRGDLHDPLLRQVLPLDAEMRPVPGFGLDAVGDGAAKTADGVIQKYRGRALLIATGSCAVHCRYCFRRHFPYAEETAARDGWREAVAAIAADPSIDEVLLSGGDPLSLATGKLAELTDALAAIGHIKRLRIHSRLPVVLPERVDAPLLAWLRSLPWPVAFVIHANHANEFDTAVDAAMRALRDTGAQLLNQAVLLRGVNDSVDALATLSERSFAAGVLPYYLHQLDRVAGVAHFEVDDAHARVLHTELATRLSGYLVPRLVREIPGDTGKRPL
ncbi:EF-P beta-lysylation protein EpmB [Xanthomonas hortorum]|uniref:L-lysine 2,3-aminomutase n=1 Tax=Xanthomonas hortorum pv. pelargonii TaxID=453602 RepID=A0A6V7CWW6_9XANT|nr:EF-P beta-lysylation protein EpmB [Xanthomonas hortorum]MCE4353355.1 EF-P beta-lysylation protein EpmB [Xanthomonas hortorum pv. pelargonii]MCM5526066.1 EF-P beta-lysylation protein EpmB [Xanthomonas hortorum pv. pelargonii]MCM5538276.1 EF-P beta-lysylation protein EpmB [Xanthomonas hortorum pv. pelargonii]MCM5542002.1 EF-P beta-lysylation protein EpmB [Xanthomonas hortorum pv. pelargonii]MCM5546200.1 EF-P beta-lysylation protein EpmB [Xanthomonas hortorum pv. pelargonii]